MLQEWIQVIQRDSSELYINLLGGSIHVEKWYYGSKMEMKPVKVKWASLYEDSLENARQFRRWLDIAIELAEQIEQVITTPEDFGRIRVYRTSLNKLSIVDMGDIFIVVPDDLQLVE